MAQLLESIAISGGSLYRLVSESGFPVIGLNSNESNLRKLLNKEKDERTEACLSDNWDIQNRPLSCEFTDCRGFAMILFLLETPNVFIRTHARPFLGFGPSSDLL